METALFADPTSRIVSGLLLPFDELSQPSANGTEPVMFSASTVELPLDPAAATLTNLHEVPTITLGYGVELVEKPEGIVASFSVVRTPAGDALLQAANDPDPTKRPKLSAEVVKLVRRGARAVSAVLTGAAVVPKGAFAGAGLFSAIDDAVEVLEEEDPEELPEQAQATLVDTVTAAVLDALKSSTETTAPEAPTQEETMTASVPNGLPHPGHSSKDKTSATGLFAALANAKRTGNYADLEPYLGGNDAMFALASIQHAGPSGATIAADIAEPAYIGQLWNRRKYQRRFFDLCGTAPLTSFDIVGWQWVDGKEPQMDVYSGNNTEIPSNAVDTEPVKQSARRVAGGHRIDRRYTDFPDQGFWEAYFDAMSESYSRKSDMDALSTMIAASTAVAPGAVPADVAKGLAAIVDGALGVIATENTPTFSVVSPELWRDIVLTGKDEVLGYLSAGFGLEEGTTAGFRILPGPVGAGKVLTGAKEARTMYELPGGAPIRVEGLVPANGAIEPALYGYIGDVTHNAKALSLVTVAGA